MSYLPPSFGASYFIMGLFYVQTSYFCITGLLQLLESDKGITFFQLNEITDSPSNYLSQ
jgi:hypothetical protein